MRNRDFNSNFIYFVICIYLLAIYFSVFESESTWIVITELSIAHNYTNFCSVIMRGIIKIIIDI